ncbi:MAG: hypothetical protein IV097_24460 [Burkholderiaceae bacterium]|nr:hypothetical protein [Burkholderiaceae bacterium]
MRSSATCLAGAAGQRALGHAKLAAVGDLQRAVAQRRVERLTLQGSLGDKIHELAEGNAQHKAPQTAQVQVRPAAGIVQGGGEQLLVIAHRAHHITAQQTTAQQTHHGANTRGILRQRMARAVQAQPEAVRTLGNLQRLVQGQAGVGDIGLAGVERLARAAPGELGIQIGGAHPGFAAGPAAAHDGQLARQLDLPCPVFQRLGRAELALQQGLASAGLVR